MIGIRKDKKDKNNYKTSLKTALFISLINLSDIHLEKDVFLIPLSFRKLGYKILYIVGSNNVKEGIDDIDLIELKKINFIKLIISILQNLGKVKPQIIFMYPLWRYQLFINLVLIIYKIISVKKLVVILKLDTDGNLDSIPRNKALVKAFFFASIISTDITIVESNDAKDRLLSYYNKFMRDILAKKIYVMPNGLTTELILKYKEFRTKYAQFKSNKILVNSRVTETKGLYELILALSKIKDEIKDWVIHIVGPIEDENYYLKLKSVIDHLGLKDKIIFLGKLKYEDLIKEYVTSKIFVLPSKKEGFSIARLNAMAACLPVVSTDTGGAEIVRDCCGIVVPVGDVDSLSEAIKKLIKDTELRERYSKNACDKVENFNFDYLVRNLLNYIEEKQMLE